MYNADYPFCEKSDLANAFVHNKHDYCSICYQFLGNYSEDPEKKKKADKQTMGSLKVASS